MGYLEIVKSLYEGSVEERGQRLQQYVAEDVLWQESEGYVYGGCYRGLEEVFQRVFLPQSTEWTDFSSEAEQLIADGDSVVALGFYQGTHNQTKKAFRARFAHHWQLHEGKITRFTQYVDSHTVWLATTS